MLPYTANERRAPYNPNGESISQRVKGAMQDKGRSLLTKFVKALGCLSDLSDSSL